MPPFDTKHRAINAFRVGEEYLFKHHFPSDLFEELRDFYDPEEYRFAVPADEMSHVVRLLRGNYYEVELVEDPERFSVVLRRDAEQPPEIFEQAVMRQRARYHYVYLLEDLAAVEEAVYRGADPLAETDIEGVY